MTGIDVTIWDPVKLTMLLLTVKVGIWFEPILTMLKLDSDIKVGTWILITSDVSIIELIDMLIVMLLSSPTT